ncbi:MAG: tetratricopeptide repeat protein [Deltaproteobacteria bacterium]
MREDPYNLLNEAAVSLKKKNFEKAALLYHELGDYFSKKGFYDKAVVSYQKSLALVHNPDLYLLIANIYETLHQSFAALEMLNQALENLRQKEPTHPLVSVIQQKIAKKIALPETEEARWENMMRDAKLLLEENLFSDAKKIYEKILLENPGHAEVKLRLSETKEKEAAFLGKREETNVYDLIQSLEKDLGLLEEPPAEKLVQTKTSLQSLPRETIYDLAVGYKEMGFYSKSIDHLRQALNTLQAQKNLSSADVSFKVNCVVLLAICQLEEKRFSDAISILVKTLKDHEEQLQKIPKEYRLTLLYILAESFERSGDMRSALFSLRRIEREDRKYRDIDDRIRKIRSKIAS